MARRESELTIRETAKLLSLHRNTVRRWAQDIVSFGGIAKIGKIKLNLTCRRDTVGRFWFRRVEVEKYREIFQSLGKKEDMETVGRSHDLQAGDAVGRSDRGLSL